MQEPDVRSVWSKIAYPTIPDLDYQKIWCFLCFPYFSQVLLCWLVWPTAWSWHEPWCLVRFPNPCASGWHSWQLGKLTKIVLYLILMLFFEWFFDFWFLFTTDALFLWFHCCSHFLSSVPGWQLQSFPGKTFNLGFSDYQGIWELINLETTFSDYKRLVKQNLKGNGNS